MRAPSAIFLFCSLTACVSVSADPLFTRECKAAWTREYIESVVKPKQATFPLQERYSISRYTGTRSWFINPFLFEAGSKGMTPEALYEIKKPFEKSPNVGRYGPTEIMWEVAHLDESMKRTDYIPEGRYFRGVASQAANLQKPGTYTHFGYLSVFHSLLDKEVDKPDFHFASDESQHLHFQVIDVPANTAKAVIGDEKDKEWVMERGLRVEVTHVEQTSMQIDGKTVPVTLYYSKVLPK